MVCEGENIPFFTATSPPPPGRVDHAPSAPEWAESLEAGLHLLKMKIRTSK